MLLRLYAIALVSVHIINTKAQVAAFVQVKAVVEDLCCCGAGGGSERIAKVMRV
jgi:hypothetical protein